MQLQSRLALVGALVLSMFSVPAAAAVSLAQTANPFDRSFERLPDLRLVRGAQPKQMKLTLTAGAAEAWTVAVDGDFMTVTPTSGTGPATLTVTFDGNELRALSDPTGTITVTGDDVFVQNVNFDIWPKVFDGALITGSDRGALRDYAKNTANWPKDGFGGGWELWGFIPDQTTHPDRLSGPAPIDVAERTPCAPGQTTGCTREGQAGLTSGMAADQGWLLSTGDPRVIIGVLDSGIKWSEGDLINKFYVNANELKNCPPPGADVNNPDPFVGFDVNHDGLFNIRDYDEAPWLADINFNGRRDPQDLIWATFDDGNGGGGACSDGVDDDGDGYVDNISGWDFFWNDNDPSDDSDFGHGTGEANDSGAEVHDGGGRPGICPRCQLLMVRVGDSFVCDVNQFADGAVFVVDSGGSVIQEALGTLTNTPYAQAAIDYAYDNGVPIIASAADETSYHHNYPGNLEHTMYVHAIVHSDDNEFESSTYLNFNNCTNFGGHLMLSTPGEGCSSEATGNTSGQTGLLMSYFRQEQDRAVGTPRAGYFSNKLSAEEVYQILVASADDIDVEGAESDADAKALKKYPSNEGWDLHFGWGRNNVRRSLELIRDQAIPPEANLSAPRWFEVVDPDRRPTLDVVGSVGSPRLTDLRWELFVSEQIVGAPLKKVAEGTGAKDDEVLFTLDLKRDVPLMVARAKDPAGSDPEQFSGVIELHTFGTNPDGQEVQGKFRKTFGVRADPTVHEGFPIFLGASGESSPKLTDVDGDGREEIILATSDGLIHAISSDTTELPGFPVHLDAYATVNDAVCAATPAKCHRAANAYASGAVDKAGLFMGILANVGVGDLDGDGDGCRDIVAASLDGFVYAFDCNGAVKPGFPVEIDRTTTPDGLTGARRCERDGNQVIGCRDEQLFNESGFFSTPVLVDLDKDGSLEIVIGGLDSRLYAWHVDGTLVNGWPVHLQNLNEPAFRDGELNRLEDRIVASPAVADLFGDGTPYIVVGTNERVLNVNGGFLYAVHPEGNAHEGGPFPAGWPVTAAGFIPDEILPYIGRGNPSAPVAADMNGDGADEVINAGMGGQMQIIFGDASFGVQPMRSAKSDYGPSNNINTELNALTLPMINNPSIADLDGDGTYDIINGTAGTGLIAVANNGGLRADFDHSVSAWDGDNGFFHEGFPHRVWDFQFFMNYAVADIDGDGIGNVLSGDGGYFIYAPNIDGREADGFPKWTQNWQATTPAIGDLDGDQLIDVVANSREGWLWAWKTTGHVGGSPDAKTPAIQWEGFHHDDQNTANVGNQFAKLKEYPRLIPPTDGECSSGCCCDSSSTNGASLAGFFALATLGLARRRARRA